MPTTILPNSNLGVFGGGQLGRMFVCAARTMGYRTTVFDPDPESPAGKIADRHLCAAYDDEAVLHQFAESCAAITIEFENIPIAALNAIQSKTRLLSADNVLPIIQDRHLEKTFLSESGIKTANFHAVLQAADIAAAESLFASSAILKTARLGYDGKGQYVVDSVSAAEQAFAELNGRACILEEKIDFKCELSVIVARAEDGTVVCYPPSENEHRGGILHLSKVPADCGSTITRRARHIAQNVARALQYCGVLAVEFFVTRDNQLLVNEIAPRPHNSGHYTIDACTVSQFEQQVRMMCGLPAGDVRLLSPVVMVNILGDIWRDHQVSPDWKPILQHPCAKLHLYGKQTARAGRKMGHFCILDSDPDRAEQQARTLYAALHDE